MLKKGNPEQKAYNTLVLSTAVSLSLHPVLLRAAFLTASVQLLWALREVDVGFLIVVMLDVFQVNDHVQGVGQNQQQDEGCDEAHQDGRGQDGAAVACRREPP